MAPLAQVFKDGGSKPPTAARLMLKSLWSSLR
jgi:hypothetical protein